MRRSLLWIHQTSPNSFFWLPDHFFTTTANNFLPRRLNNGNDKKQGALNNAKLRVGLSLEFTGREVIPGVGKSLSVGGMSQPSSPDWVGAHACLMELLLQLNRVSLTAEVHLFSDKKWCIETCRTSGVVSYRDWWHRSGKWNRLGHKHVVNSKCGVLVIEEKRSLHHRSGWLLFQIMRRNVDDDAGRLVRWLWRVTLTEW